MAWSPFNTAMLGPMCGFTHLIALKTLDETVRTMAPAKKEENVEAAREAITK